MQGLPGNPDAVSNAAVALAGDLQPLLDAIGVPGVPAAVRSALEKPVADAHDAHRHRQGRRRAGPDCSRASPAGRSPRGCQWRPADQAVGRCRALPNIFKPKPDSLHIDVEVRASASAPPAVDIVAEIVDFDLNLIGDGDAGLMKLMFRRIGFHAGSAGKPEVDVVFGGIGFLGPLSFVDRLRELIPFDGFSDPPYVDVAPDGRDRRLRPHAAQRVGRRVQPGEHLAGRRRAGAVPRRRDDRRVPLLLQGRAVPAHRHVHRRRRLARAAGRRPRAWSCWSWGSRRARRLSVDLGVASGSVSIAVGVYLRLEADKGLLTAYFRIRGEVDVLGLISASITLELSLTYHFETGKLIGRASLVVEIEVLFFSASVEISVERQLAGSKGDPTMYQVMPPDGRRHERRLGRVLRRVRARPPA